jgi:hypothetical protein
MSPKTSINIEWTNGVQIQHTITDFTPTPERSNPIVWILAPSVPLFLALQFGAMRPSQSLIVSGWILEMLFQNRYTLMPINSALRAARIDFVYIGVSSPKIQFHPEHSLFANSDSLEEGVCQLINNYSHHVYSKLDDYMAITVRTFTVVAIGLYFSFLESQVSARAVGRGKDRWSPAFSIYSANTIKVICENYFVLSGGRTQENEQYAQTQTRNLLGKYSEVTTRRNELLTTFGLQ